MVTWLIRDFELLNSAFLKFKVHIHSARVRTTEREVVAVHVLILCTCACNGRHIATLSNSLETRFLSKNNNGAPPDVRSVIMSK